MKNIVISGLAVLFVIIIISCLGATGIKEGLTPTNKPSTWLVGTEAKWNTFAGAKHDETGQFGSSSSSCGNYSGADGGAWWGNGDVGFRCCPLDGGGVKGGQVDSVWFFEAGRNFCGNIPEGLPCSVDDQCAGHITTGTADSTSGTKCLKYTGGGEVFQNSGPETHARLCMPPDQKQWPKIVKDSNDPTSAIGKIWAVMTGTSLKQTPPTKANDFVLYDGSSGSGYDPNTAAEKAAKAAKEAAEKAAKAAAEKAAAEKAAAEAAAKAAANQRGGGGGGGGGGNHNNLGPGGEGPPNTFPRPPSTNTTHGKKLARLSCAVYPA